MVSAQNWPKLPTLNGCNSNTIYQNDAKLSQIISAIQILNIMQETCCSFFHVIDTLSSYDSVCPTSCGILVSSTSEELWQIHHGMLLILLLRRSFTWGILRCWLGYKLLNTPFEHPSYLTHIFLNQMKNYLCYSFEVDPYTN